MPSRILTAAPMAAKSIVALADRLLPGTGERLLLDVVGDRLPDATEARVPADLIPRLLVAAIDITARPDLPVVLAANAPLRRFGPLAYCVATCPTLGDAFGQVQRFLGLWNEGMTIGLTLGAAGGTLDLRPRPPGKRDDRGRRALLELSVAALLATAREVTGVALTAQRIELDSQSEGLTALELFAGCAVEYGAAISRITLAAETLALPLIGADVALAAIVSAHVEERLSRMIATDTWSGRTRDALVAHVGRSPCELADVARQLNVSTRTLQRRLAEENGTFAELLDDVRRELGMRYLAANTLGTGEIAYLLGFAELSAFHHAFRRWTGVTPVGWRKAQLAPAGKRLAP
jgi:AraC-like DNA-binding protein